jgi:hypothetical protein
MGRLKTRVAIEGETLFLKSVADATDENNPRETAKNNDRRRIMIDGFRSGREGVKKEWQSY